MKALKPDPLLDEVSTQTVAVQATLALATGIFATSSRNTIIGIFCTGH